MMLRFQLTIIVSFGLAMAIIAVVGMNYTNPIAWLLGTRFLFDIVWLWSRL